MSPSISPATCAPLERRLFLQIASLLTLAFSNTDSILVTFAYAAVPAETAGSRGSADFFTHLFKSSKLCAALTDMTQALFLPISDHLPHSMHPV
jgi:hypothetical protein